MAKAKKPAEPAAAKSAKVQERLAVALVRERQEWTVLRAIGQHDTRVLLSDVLAIDGDFATPLALEEGVFELLFDEVTKSRAAGDSTHWRVPMLTRGLPSVLAAANKFAAAGDLADLPGSTLYAMGEAIAYEFRRRTLLAELESTEWNLAHVADRLRLKSSGKVLEAIRSHGLEGQYEAAKKSGLVPGKGHRPRAKPPKAVL